MQKQPVAGEMRRAVSYVHQAGTGEREPGTTLTVHIAPGCIGTSPPERDTHAVSKDETGHYTESEGGRQPVEICWPSQSAIADPQREITELGHTR
jgi:hypothetical protein